MAIPIASGGLAQAIWFRQLGSDGLIQMAGPI